MVGERAAQAAKHLCIALAQGTGSNIYYRLDRTDLRNKVFAWTWLRSLKCSTNSLVRHSVGFR